MPNIKRVFLRYIIFGIFLLVCVIFWTLLYNGLLPNQQHIKADDAIPTVPARRRGSHHEVAQQQIKKDGVTSTVSARRRDPPRLIVYNKVSKCASSSLVSIIRGLGAKNNFSIYQDKARPDTGGKRINSKSLPMEAETIMNLPSPGVYSKHLYYIDFKRLGYKQPIYINLVRDPIERFVSHFYFEQVGSNGQDVTTSKIVNINDCILKNHSRCTLRYHILFITLFFCGHDQACLSDDKETLRLAKNHLENDYLFVGLAEEFETSLQVLEILMPFYFEGASVIWKKQQQQKRQYGFATKMKHELTPEARKVMKKRLEIEYEFYNLAKKLFDDAKLAVGVV